MPEDLKQLKEYVRLPQDGKRPLVSAFEVIGRRSPRHHYEICFEGETVGSVTSGVFSPMLGRGIESRIVEGNRGMVSQLLQDSLVMVGESTRLYGSHV